MDWCLNIQKEHLNLRDTSITKTLIHSFAQVAFDISMLTLAFWMYSPTKKQNKTFVGNA